MIDHIGLRTAQFDVMTAFYEQALAPLGIKKLMAFDSGAGFGRDAQALWVSLSNRPRDGGGEKSSGALELGPIGGPRVSHWRPQGRREVQWRARSARLCPQLLRRLRHRPRRQQHRGGLP